MLDFDIDGKLVMVTWEVHHCSIGKWEKAEDMTIGLDSIRSVGWAEGNHDGYIVLHSQSLTILGEDKCRLDGIVTIPKYTILDIYDLTEKKHIDISSFQTEYVKLR